MAVDHQCAIDRRAFYFVLESLTKGHDSGRVHQLKAPLILCERRRLKFASRSSSYHTDLYPQIAAVTKTTIHRDACSAVEIIP
jgi:hypothetical protein